MAKDNFTARVAALEIELGMSVQNKSGIWCKPTVRMNIAIDGGTDPTQREAMMGIVPEETDTLDTRRFRVLTKWNNYVPYDCT